MAAQRMLVLQLSPELKAFYYWKRTNIIIQVFWEGKVFLGDMVFEAVTRFFFVLFFLGGVTFVAMQTCNESYQGKHTMSEYSLGGLSPPAVTPFVLYCK